MDELERLDVRSGFIRPARRHSGRCRARYVGHANFHPIAHAIRNPVELMGALASLTSGGVLDRHPKLRAAPFSKGRRAALLVAVAARRPVGEVGPGCERQISMLPTDYFRRQCYVALDVDEEPAVDVVNKLGAEYFVVSSDYPHSDGAFPRRSSNFSACRSATSNGARSCGTIAPVYTQSKPRRCLDPRTEQNLSS